MAEIGKTMQYTFTVEVTANSRQFVLDKRSPVTDGVVTAIRTRRSGTNVRTLQGAQIPNDANFDAAFVVLKYGTTEVFQVPLAHIERATLQEATTGFPVNLESIDWSSSYVYVADSVTLDAGKFFEFTIEFYKKRK